MRKLCLVSIALLSVVGCGGDSTSSSSGSGGAGGAGGTSAGGGASDLSYPIVETGQDTCYGGTSETVCPDSGQPFFGQDSQYLGFRASYDTSADGLTVHDNVTDLTWQRSPDTDGDGAITASDKRSHAGATEYCQSLGASSFAGFDDWRLPSIKEMYSLIDFRGTDPSGLTSDDTSGLTPFIDANHFEFAYGDTNAGERVIDSQYASSTLYVSSASEEMLFGVNLADGRIKGYGLSLRGADKTFLVQCVRGNTAYGSNQFVDNSDDTVSDAATGLMWSRLDSGSGVNWQEALAWAEEKNASNWLGYDDWRLPNVKELQSIVDYTRSPDTSDSPALDPVFSATGITNEDGAADWPFFWASTSHVAHNGMSTGTYVAFGRAPGWMQEPGASCYSFADVHGAGAQRSDPKNGSADTNYLGSTCSGGDAYGFGPQGDILRVQNFVRLVRRQATPVSPSGGSGGSGGGGGTSAGGSSGASGSCDSCEQDTVCCPDGQPCAGECVPDCRLGVECPTDLSCDQNSGVCLP